MLLPLIFYGGKEVNIDKNILNFLIKNNYAKTDKMTLTVRNDPTYFSFLYYTRELEPYILRRSGQSGFEIILAQRKLKSIGHTNSYTANIYGANVKVWAFTFVYTLENKLPGLPKVMKEFEGKAKAYLDPDDGKWKVEGVSLSDRGDAEYLDMLSQELMVDSQRMQKSLKVSNLSYRYGSNSISFIFNLEGGVPPYRYDWPTINGVPMNNLLYPYRTARRGFNGPLYHINFQDVKDGSGAITIAMENELGFGWPPDIAFPLKIMLRLHDASSPPKVATLETTVPSGQRFSPEWRNEILGFDNWIEKDGKRMSSGKGREDLNITGQTRKEEEAISVPTPPPTYSRRPSPAAPPPLAASGGRWPWTSGRLIREDELWPLSLMELELMRNEIYARHGWVFNRRDLQDYFGRQPWYQPKSDLSNREQSNRWAQAELTGIEKKNIHTIVSREKVLKR